uniref:hypothetical protein n=1 Tax=Streptomyces malaysiensis TaxID=92644 RepID=UPI001AD9164E|nr:hypothetical protein [Streptomyces malaysiensis]
MLGHHLRQVDRVDGQCVTDLGKAGDEGLADLVLVDGTGGDRLVVGEFAGARGCERRGALVLDEADEAFTGQHIAHPRRMLRSPGRRSQEFLEGLGGVDLRLLQQPAVEQPPPDVVC